MWKIFITTLTLLLLVSCSSDGKKVIQADEVELDKGNQQLQFDEQLDDEDLILHNITEIIPQDEEELDQPTVIPVTITTTPTENDNLEPIPQEVITYTPVLDTDENTPQIIHETPILNTDDEVIPIVEIEDERINFPCDTFEYDEPARRAKLEKIIINEEALEELIEIEQYVCNILSDKHLRKWINSRAYGPNEYTIIKRPQDVENNKEDYYTNFLTLKSLAQEMEYHRCRGVYYANGPWPEYSPDSEKHNGFMIQIKGRFFGLWSHCGYPADILMDLVGEEQVKRIEAGLYE